ncbi:MAG: TIGR00730 family Rossman fold protein [Gammaproteobacteria bacterium]|nr:TIGR00730 family Rossman fold protein [Gammaproteobacteria bacterium]
MKKLCVFCGARSGNRPAYRTAAQAFGTALVHAKWDLVYGGGRVGLMGEVAQAALDAGGYVTGIIPGFLHSREAVHPGLQVCHTVGDLFERKSMMLEISDAFVALPGGVGTYDELLEVIAWRQLRQLNKPIGLLNVDNFFAPWLGALAHAATEGFIAQAEIDGLLVAATPEELLAKLVQSTP